MLRALGASRWDMVVKIGMPRSLPYFFASLKIAITLSFVGTVIAEIVAGNNGIGNVMLIAGSNFNVPLVFAALLVVGIMGIGMYAIFAALEHRFAGWSMRGRRHRVRRQRVAPPVRDHGSCPCRSSLRPWSWKERRAQGGRAVSARAGRVCCGFPSAGTRDVAFVRSPIAHGRIRHLQIPDTHKAAVFTAKDLVNVKPIQAATALNGFKHSREPVLAIDKVRYVGELIAACIARSLERPRRSPQASRSTTRSSNPSSTCSRRGGPEHHSCTSNGPITSSSNLSRKGTTAPPCSDRRDRAHHGITREIRTARQCMFPIEGRAVIAYRDGRLGFLTIISATQMPHIVQRGVAGCLGLDDGSVRVISPDVGGGFGYKGLLCREEVVLGWLAMHCGTPVRWLEDCREHLSANANCREHHYRITGYADDRGKLLALDCVAHVDAGAYSVYPTSSALEAAQVASLLPGPYDFNHYRCRSAAVATNKCPILPYRGVARSGVCLAIEAVMDGIAQAAASSPMRFACETLCVPSRCRSKTWPKKSSTAATTCFMRTAVAAIGLSAIRERQRKGESRRTLARGRFFNLLRTGCDGNNGARGMGSSGGAGLRASNMRLTADGNLEIRVGTHSHGQGHETTLAQVAHEILGIDFGRIKVLHGDTL